MPDTAATTTSQQEKSGGLSGSTLKLIAIITMFIDHLGVVALESRALIIPITSMEDYVTLMQTNGQYAIPYFVMRLIGRLAFPIFCFLLVEGFLHTRDVKKYALRLLAFAFISEIPFDLAMRGQIFDWYYQNVFFTLFIGLTVIALIELAKKIFQGFFRFVVDTVVLVAGLLLAQLLYTDYGSTGVLTIVFIYLFKRYKNNILSMAVATLWLSTMNTIEATCLVDILLVKFYNGKRGLNLKYVFYAFYPVHLLLLYVIFHIILG